MEEDIDRLRDALSRVSAIMQKDKAIKEERRARGEMFNTFNVLHHWGEEVTVHSRFIAELLNPRGSHGCGAQLLEAFCNTAGITDFNCEGAKVEVEKDIGPISKDGTEGGRLDIFIEQAEQAEQADRKKCIVIENKIYAGDESNQLLRYKNYCDKTYGDGNWTLLYLTLDRHEPSGESTGALPSGEKPYWRCISYRDDIAKWLDDCVHTAAAARKEKVRVGIGEYLELVKQITGDDMEEEMIENMAELLARSEGKVFADFVELWGNDAAFKAAKVKIFTGVVEPRIKAKLHDTWPDMEWFEAGEEGKWFSFGVKYKGFNIDFVFEEDDFVSLTYGLTLKDESKRDVFNAMASKAKENGFVQGVGDNKNTLYAHVTDYENWKKDDRGVFAWLVRDTDSESSFYERDVRGGIEKMKHLIDEAEK